MVMDRYHGDEQELQQEYDDLQEQKYWEGADEE